MNNATIKPLWSKRLDNSPVLQYLIAKDLLLLAPRFWERQDLKTHLLALSCIGGELLWSIDFDDIILVGLEDSERLKSESLIFLTATNRDFLVDEVFVWSYDHSGKERWRWRGESQTISTPVFFDGLISFTVDSEVFICLDAATGSEQLRANLDITSSFAAPSWYNDIAFIPGSGSHLTAINRKGKQRWHYQAEGSSRLDKTPIFVDDQVLVVSSKGSLLAINVANGILLWQKVIGSVGRQLSPPTTDGNHVYIGARDGVYAVDAKAGQLIWSFPTDRSVSAQPVIHNQIVYATSHDHHIYALNADNGEEIWRYQMERRIELPPIIGETDNHENTIVYVVDHGGKIVALQYQPMSQAIHAPPEDPFKHDDMVETIKQLEYEGKHTHAAESWYEIGNLERAAEQFELAGKWQRAADLWHQLGRFFKYAQALEGLARSIEDEDGNHDERVMAWSNAAKAYQAEGEKAKAEFCQLQVAKYEKQPFLDLSIEHDGLALNVWSELQLAVRNIGFGPARRIDVHTSGNQFAGQVASSKEYFKLLPGKELRMMLTVRPLQYGDSVPMVLILDYHDNKAQMCKLEKTIFVPVAREQSERVIGQIQNVFTTSLMTGKGSKPLTNLAKIDLVELRRKLAIYFNISELHDLCFELKIDAEELIRDRKSEFAREIILYLQRRKRLRELISFCQHIRPHIDW